MPHRMHARYIRSVIKKFPEWLYNNFSIELSLNFAQTVHSAHPYDENEGSRDLVRPSCVLVEAQKRMGLMCLLRVLRLA